MKKSLLLLSLVFLLSKATTLAQPVPNGGFEAWNSIPYSDPTGWHTGNTESLRHMGAVSVTQVSGQTGFAVRMQTSIVGSDTSSPYISNSHGDPMEGAGGFPFSQQPTAFTGYYKYNLVGSDSALLLVFFKKNGTVFSPNLFKITGSQNTWTAFSFPLSLPMVPDSVILAAASSNLIDNIGVQNGSFLELDGLGFAGASQTIPNGDFENWTNNSYDLPVGWTVEGEDVSKTTDNYAGSFAVRLVTGLSGDGMVNSSGITTGHHVPNGPPTGGLPYTLMTDTLIGYYKYMTVGADTANIYVSLSKNSSSVGGNGKWLLPVSNYTYFEMPFNASQTPDTMRVDIRSSGWPLSPSAVGSSLYIDNLSLKSMLTGVIELGNGQSSMIVYPNPAKTALNILLKKTMQGNVQLSVFDVSGRLVKEESYDSALMRFQLNIADLSSGVYHFEVKSSEGTVSSQFVKE